MPDHVHRPHFEAPSLVPASGRFRAEVVERPGGEWDPLAAGFGDMCMEQTIAFMGARLYEPGDSATFGTAANIAASEAGATLVVTFLPGASNADMSALLTSLDAVIVDGPKPGNAYVLRLPSADPADVAAAMEKLVARKDLVQSVLRGS